MNLKASFATLGLTALFAISDSNALSRTTPYDCVAATTPDAGPSESPTLPPDDECSGIRQETLVYGPDAVAVRPFIEKLAALRDAMMENPACRVVVTGSGGGSKFEQQLSWERVDGIIEHMSEVHGIDRNRFIFKYGAEGDARTVTYRPATEGEEGPSSQPRPHPNLRN